VADLDKKLLDDIVKDVVSLLIRKNKDYGNSYFTLREEFGTVAFIIRLVDKTERLKCLSKSEPQVKEEKEEDTIKDIVGYCLLELYYRKTKQEETKK